MRLARADVYESLKLLGCEVVSKTILLAKEHHWVVADLRLKM